jgi:chromosomal replication initiation ATPase DnaA
MVNSSAYAIPGIVTPNTPEEKVEKITQVVLKYFGLTEQSLKGRCKKTRILIARYFCFYFTKRYTTYSLTDIGNLFGGRDHGTVSNGLSKLNEIRQENYQGYGDHFKVVQRQLSHLNYFVENEDDEIYMQRI